MSFSDREKILISAIILLLVSNLYLFYEFRSIEGQALSPEEINSIFVDETAEPSTIGVHVAGGVNNGGILYMEKGSRVADAIEAAGGAVEGADLDRINLAKLLDDEEKVYVPLKGEDTSEINMADTISVSDGRININTASTEELESLPGIGEVLARRIIEYREREGVFKFPEDIMNVSGIGSKIFEGIKDKIKVR